MVKKILKSDIVKHKGEVILFTVYTQLCFSQLKLPPAVADSVKVSNKQSLPVDE